MAGLRSLVVRHKAALAQKASSKEPKAEYSSTAVGPELVQSPVQTVTQTTTQAAQASAPGVHGSSSSSSGGTAFPQACRRSPELLESMIREMVGRAVRGPAPSAASPQDESAAGAT
eukprot:11155766-Alexandrium_andersonii.AAC.1